MKYTVNQYNKTILIHSSFTYDQYLTVFQKYGNDYTYSLKENNFTYTCNFN